MEQIRGVNLGGWLVLERWISPSVFRGVSGRDEYSLIRELGPIEARERLEKHWATFITKDDFRYIKELGLNTVRLPVGYWLVADQDGFLGGADAYVSQVFDWAREYNIQVILCLHGAPGSQNGNDHSGKTGKIGWYSYRNITKSLEAIRLLCERYGEQPMLRGVELLNEPHVRGWWRRWLLFQYYLRAGRLVEVEAHAGVSVVMSDAFQAARLIPRIVGLPLERPVVDTHMYQLFSDDDRVLDFEGHIEKTKRWEHELKNLSVGAQVIVGEWSAAMDELYEPSLRTKARFFTPEQYREFAQEQRRVFEAAGAGWVYWTARTEDAGVWSLLDHPEFVL